MSLLDTKTYYANNKAISLIDDLIKAQKTSFLENKTPVDSYNNGFQFDIFKDDKNNKIFTQKKDTFKVDIEKMEKDYPNLIIKEKSLKSVPQIIKINPKLKDNFKFSEDTISLKQTNYAKNNIDIEEKVSSILSKVDQNNITELLQLKQKLTNENKELNSFLLKTFNTANYPNIAEMSKFLEIKEKNSNRSIPDTLLELPFTDVYIDSYDWIKEIYDDKINNKLTYENFIANNVDTTPYIEKNTSYSLISVNDTEKCDRVYYGYQKDVLKEDFLLKYFEALNNNQLEFAQEMQKFYLENSLNSTSFDELYDSFYEVSNSSLDMD